MTLLELIKDKLKLDFTSTLVVRDAGRESLKPFELSARDFLRYAKSDFKINNEKGNIGALTNAKRAIDCQIDTAFTLFGIKYDNISSSSNKIIELTGISKEDLPHKLKLIQALDFAPSWLISKTRSLRNRLEHYYEIPKKEEVKEAIELAELFVLSIDSHIKMIAYSFIITDKKNYDDKFPWKHGNYIGVGFTEQSKEISLQFCVNNKRIDDLDLTLNEHDCEFYAFIKLINNFSEEIEMEESLRVLLKMINHPIPEKNIRLEVV